MPDIIVNQTVDEITLPPYKVYTAFVEQTGTDNPAATVVENTLGSAVVWARTGVGQYTATFGTAPEFADYKIFFPNTFNVGVGTSAMPISDGAVITAYYQIYRGGDNTVLLQIFDLPYTTTIEWSAVAGQLSIEFRAYPPTV